MAFPSLSNYDGFLRTTGLPGELADSNPIQAIDCQNTQSVAIPPGYAVARDTSSANNVGGNAGTVGGAGLTLMPCKAPAVDTDPIIGIAIHHAIAPVLGPAQGGSTPPTFGQNKMVPVLKSGRMFAQPAENVNAGDAVVSLTAQNGALGSAANNSEDTAVAAVAGNGKATGTITMTNQALAGDTVTVNGVVFTFVASGAIVGSNQVNLGTTKQLTAAALQAALAASLNPLLTIAEYTVSGAVVTVTMYLGGTAGNAYTLATSDATNIAVSAATLASGTANTGNATIALGGQPTQWDAIAGVYDIVCATATTALVYKPSGDLLGTLTFGTQFNDEIVVTITAGGTPCVAGDSFTVTVTNNAGRITVPGAFWEQTGGPSSQPLTLRINTASS